MHKTKLFALPIVLFTTVALAQPKPAPSTSTTTSAAPSGSSTTNGAMTSSDVAAKVQKAYDAINTYEADFTQQYSMKAFGTKKESKGHVTFVKPGKMRWDYTEPKDNVVVSDGVTLWSYVASDKAARKMLVKDSQMPTALAFLMGKGDLTKDFDLKLLDSNKYKFKGGYVLEAKPKVATNLYNFVLFYVDGETFQMRRVLIVDAQDNRNRFDFDKATVNAKVEDSRFKWSPPATATVTSN